jgi:hypothetical protein
MSYNFFGGTKAKRFEVTEELVISGKVMLKDIELKLPLEPIDDLDDATTELSDVVTAFNELLAALRAAEVLAVKEEEEEGSTEE